MLPITDHAVIEIADILRIMGEPNRLKILLACLSRTMTVTELAEQLGLSMPLVCHHVRLLRAMRLVRSDRQGKHVLYSVDDEHVRCILIDMLTHFTSECAHPTETPLEDKA